MNKMETITEGEIRTQLRRYSEQGIQTFDADGEIEVFYPNISIASGLLDRQGVYEKTRWEEERIREDICFVLAPTSPSWKGYKRSKNKGPLDFEPVYDQRAVLFWKNRGGVVLGETWDYSRPCLTRLELIDTGENIRLEGRFGMSHRYNPSSFYTDENIPQFLVNKKENGLEDDAILIAQRKEEVVLRNQERAKEKLRIEEERRKEFRREHPELYAMEEEERYRREHREDFVIGY